MTRSQIINCSMIVMAYLLSLCVLQQTPLMPWPQRMLQLSLAALGVVAAMRVLGHL